LLDDNWWSTDHRVRYVPLADDAEELAPARRSAFAEDLYNKDSSYLLLDACPLILTGRVAYWGALSRTFSARHQKEIAPDGSERLRERFERGCFTNIDGSGITVTVDHDPDPLVSLASSDDGTLMLSEDEKGIAASIRTDSSVVRDQLMLMAGSRDVYSGSLGTSLGYGVSEASWSRVWDCGVRTWLRTVHRAAVLHVSLCSYAYQPLYEGTYVRAVHG
jgi:phage head maturation protease